ncbi:unnamed protein product [Cochlearia groenlandica]
MAAARYLFRNYSNQGRDFLSSSNRRNEISIEDPTLNDTYVANPNLREIERIAASGYDINLPHADVVKALRELFSPCGNITDIFISVYENLTLHRNFFFFFGVDRFAFIYFVGKGSAEKACMLNGSKFGGWDVEVEEYTFPDEAGWYPLVKVRGYNTSLGKIKLKKMLREHFSSCGKVEEVYIFKSLSAAAVYVYGEDAGEKVMQLDGSYMGGCKLHVEVCGEPEIYSVHPRRPLPGCLWP